LRINQRHDWQILVVPTSVPNEEGMWAGGSIAESIRSVSAVHECHRSSLHHDRLSLKKWISNANWLWTWLVPQPDWTHWRKVS